MRALHSAIASAVSYNLDICCRRPLPTRTRPVVHMSRKHMHMHIVGTVDECGYDGLLKYTICEVCRPEALDSKHTETSFSPTSTDSLYLQIDQVPRCQDLVILMVTTDKQTDRQINRLPFTPAHAHRDN